MKKQSNYFSGLLLAGLSLVCLIAQAQAPTYNIIDLGTLGTGNTTVAYAINNVGQVTGYFITTDGREHPFLYTNGQMKDLGNLATGPLKPNRDRSIGEGINDAGQVVGTATAGNDTSFAYSAFLYSNNVMQSLGVGVAYAINNQGQVVGTNSMIGPFLYQNGQYTYLSGLPGGGGAAAYAISENGQIAGASNFIPNNGETHAVVWQNGVLQDLGVPTGFVSTIAIGINDSGQIAGYGYYLLNGGSYTEALLWQNGQVQHLGTLGGPTSDATGINSSGVIVGFATLANGQGTAFVYQNGQMHDVFAGTGWANGSANAINDAGQIVGYGFPPSGASVFHAFLATPTTATIRGVIALGGIVPEAPAQTVTIEFRPADNSSKIVQTVTVGPDGKYSVSGLPQNVYTISFKGAKWLRKTLPDVNLNSGNVSNVNVTLPAGDANNDNVVDIVDFGVLVNSYGGDSTDPESGYDERADFACSGTVDLGSFGLLVNSYGLTGDQ